MNGITDIFQGIQPRYPELSGQVAVVTGAAGGIGRGIALRLAREGMRVLLIDQKTDDLEVLAHELQSAGADAAACSTDLIRPEAPEQIIAAALKRWGALHLLVNNAADLRRQDFLTIDELFFDHQIAVNFKAPFFLSRQAAEAMRRGGEGGCVLHISSVGGLRAHWRGLPYDATKSALDGMTRAMALDLAESGIRVNAIAPGAVRHERHRPLVNDPDQQAVARRIPMQRFASVWDIAAAAAFLASPDAAYITGQVLYVDGGLTVQLSPPGQDV